MKRSAVLRLLTCVLGFAGSVAAAEARPDGVWKSEASGNIPIALLTISGGSYAMQAVSDTAWTPKADDSSNGGGGLDIQGNRVMPTSGPLFDIYGAVGSYCAAGETNCSGESLMLDSTKGIGLGCWRDG